MDGTRKAEDGIGDGVLVGNAGSHLRGDVLIAEKTGEAGVVAVQIVFELLDDFI